MTELLSLRHAADRLGVHVGTFRAWVRSGQVPAYRVGGRFARVSWDEVLRALRTGDQPSVDRLEEDEPLDESMRREKVSHG